MNDEYSAKAEAAVIYLEDHGYLTCCRDCDGWTDDDLVSFFDDEGLTLDD
ncbi:hypothetical protein ACFWY5_29650 [Nonomuraea sp. NPDC059007]